MDQKTIDKYVAHYKRATMGFYDPVLARRYCLAKCHTNVGVVTFNTFYKEVLRFIIPSQYYESKEDAKAIMRAELEELCRLGIFQKVIVDGQRLKGQVCYRYVGE